MFLETSDDTAIERRHRMEYTIFFLLDEDRYDETIDSVLSNRFDDGIGQSVRSFF